MPPLPDWASTSALAARARSLFRGLFRAADVERDMQEEFAHHLDARTAHLVATGVEPREAAAQARREFGHASAHRADARTAIGVSRFAGMRVSWLDVKLGLRMLPKHPVLNLAAIFALAVGIPVGLAPSHLARAIEAPLPGDSDGRVRALRLWDPLSSSVVATWSDDFTAWQGALRSFSSLGAIGSASYRVASTDGRATTVSGARLTSSVLPMIGARPAIGRLLEESDYAPGAPEVVVIGHGLWSDRFGSDPAVLGRTIVVGRTPHTVVGVMTEGFAFPTNEALWLPLRLASVGGTVERTRVQVVGRLADGVSVAAAQAEVASRLTNGSIAVAADASEAATRARLRPEVVPFGLLYLSLPAGGLDSLPEYRLAQGLMFLLLLVACGNVAMLMFARTATRLRELAIRTALGASRGRIVSQIFVETLLLAVISAGVGIFLVDFTLDHVNIAALAGEASLPYWLSLDLTRASAVQALALAAVSATVAGAFPAVLITGRAIAQNMRGVPRVRFGRFTAALVIADIAVSVAAVGMAIAVAGHANDLQAAHRATGVNATEYLAMEVRMPASGATNASALAGRPSLQRASLQRALVAALEREPGVKRVTVGDALPRTEHRSTPYEIDGAESRADGSSRWVRTARVDVGFFDALETPIVAGRGFTPSDVDGGERVAIVNSAFVQRVLEGRDPLGKRIRFPARGGAAPSRTDSAGWYRIVGVVGALGVNVMNPEHGDAVYVPAAAGTIDPLHIAVHAAVPPATLVSRARELVAAVDPELVVARVLPLAEVRQGDWYLVMGLAVGLVALVGVLVALAASGLYAMLSLAVSERTREIGIRSALGASPAGLLLTILRRSLVQIAVGAAIGLPVAARMVYDLTDTPERGGSVLQSTAIALGLSLAIVLFVGLSSCLVPTRRILAIDASEAMRADG